MARKPKSTASSRTEIVDESQDLCETELAFLAAYAGTGPDALFSAGDIGQRVVRNTFQWGDYGVSVRGRSRILKVNYRTTKEIRGAADRLMDAEGTDPDGNAAIPPLLRERQSRKPR